MARRRVCQYLGIPGNTWSCLHSVRLVLTGGGYYDRDGRELLPSGATLITRRQPSTNVTEHAFIFWKWLLGSPVVVPAGFSSGYSGEGPRGLALALLMVIAKDITVHEIEVDQGLFTRLNENALTEQDIIYLRDKGSEHVASHNYIDDALTDRDAMRLSVQKYAPYRIQAKPRIRWEWLDAEIAEKCEMLAPPSLKPTGLYTSPPTLAPCLREAFIILKSRLVDKFDVSDSFDGEQLVNKIFGKSTGILASQALDDAAIKDMAAMRDLLAGLFKVFRHKYAHNDVEVPWYEAEAVLSMITFALKRIAKY